MDIENGGKGRVDDDSKIRDRRSSSRERRERDRRDRSRSGGRRNERDRDRDRDRDKREFCVLCSRSHPTLDLGRGGRDYWDSEKNGEVSQSKDCPRT